MAKRKRYKKPDTGVRFARVPSGGETCRFCIMLASRGAVYYSEESAGKNNHYHANCRCRIVPSWGLAQIEGYDPALYYDMWQNPDKYPMPESWKQRHSYAEELAEEVAPSRQIFNVPFTPAESIAEAEEYAKRFVDLGAYKSKVDLRGMTLDAANGLNKVLTDVYNAYDIQPFASLERMNMRSNKFSGTTAEAAYEWLVHRFYYNPNYLKTEKALAEHIAEGQKLLETVKSGADSLIAKYGADSAKGLYLAGLKESGRALVAQTAPYYDAVFSHEMGHALHDMLLRGQIKEAGIDLKESRLKYAKRISGYATSSNEEYIAESFAAFYVGETSLLDPELLALFERLAK